MERVLARLRSLMPWNAPLGSMLLASGTEFQADVAFLGEGATLAAGQLFAEHDGNCDGFLGQDEVDRLGILGLQFSEEELGSAAGCSFFQFLDR